MQRGVYFDGWYPGQHNYHPSLPARRLGDQATQDRSGSPTRQDSLLLGD